MTYKVALVAPQIKKRGRVTSGVTDSELLYLGQAFYNAGYHVTVADDFYSGRNLTESLVSLPLDASTLVLDLWKNEVYFDEQYLEILKQADAWASTSKNRVAIFYGHIAATLEKYIIDFSDQFSVVQRGRVNGTRSSKEVEAAASVFSAYATDQPTITADFLTHIDFSPASKATISLMSSRGCQNSCTFCSYNRHLSKWQPRGIDKLASELCLLEDRYQLRSFALADSNIGKDPDLNASRFSDLLRLAGPRQDRKIALNVSVEGLSREALRVMAACGVKTVLIGTESFDSDIIARKFKKRSSLERVRDVVSDCGDVGIQPVLSHILFTPWTTLSTLKSELAAIRAVGAHHFPHYLANSVLHVIPGTPVERMLLREGLQCSSNSSLGFRFCDKRVELVFGLLRSHFDNEFSSVQSMRDAARLRVKEWRIAKALGLLTQ